MKIFKKNCLIKLHPLTLLYFFISFITGYWKWYLSAYLLVCFHELCHFMMAYSFHFDIDSISLLPFGAYLSLYDYGYRPILYEMCVVLAGPCSHLIIYALLYQFNRYVIVDYLLKMNGLIFLFNILPIYPMDGFRFLVLILNSFLDIKKTQYLCFKISVFFLCLFLSVCQHLNYYVIFLFLLYENILFYKNINNYLRNFFIRIPYDELDYKLKMNLDYRYIRDRKNVYRINDRIYYDYEVKDKLIKSIKRG